MPRERKCHLGVSQQGSPAAGKAGATTGCIIRGLVPAARELTSTLSGMCLSTWGVPGTVLGLALSGGQGHTESRPHVEAEWNRLLQPHLEEAAGPAVGGPWEARAHRGCSWQAQLRPPILPESPLSHVCSSKPMICPPLRSSPSLGGDASPRQASLAPLTSQPLPCSFPSPQQNPNFKPHA